MKHLKKLITQIWDGDVTLADAKAEAKLTQSQMELMDEFIGQNATLFKDGVPAEGEDDIFDEMVANEPTAQLIIKMVEALD